MPTGPACQINHSWHDLLLQVWKPHEVDQKIEKKGIEIRTPQPQMQNQNFDGSGNPHRLGLVNSPLQT